MARYKMIVAYDGADYVGWQAQPNASAITNVMQKAFYAVFKKHIRLIGASRTDAGVHALGQVAVVDIDFAIESKVLLQAWQARLPQTIVIRSLEKVQSSFHPQANVLQKTYWYHFFTKRPLPFIQRYGYFYPYALDFDKLHNALQTFVGEHDFRFFCKDPEDNNTIRTVDSISVRYIKKFHVYRIEIKGQRFLHFMIRKIVGACLETATRNFSVEQLQSMLTGKTLQRTFAMAPAKGLMLYKIQYA